MSTTTPNYGLVKPELTDVADITAMNGNWDKIDEELGNVDKQLEESVKTFTNLDQLGLTNEDFVADDFSANMRTIQDALGNRVAILHVGYRNGDSKYVFTNFYSSVLAKIGEDNGVAFDLKTHSFGLTYTQSTSKYTPAKLEVTVERATDDYDVMVFGCGINYNTNELKVGKFKPFIHPAGLLPLTGGTLSGKILLPSLDLINSAVENVGRHAINSAGAFCFVNIHPDGNTQITLEKSTYTLANVLRLVVGSQTYELHGKHNKPSGSYQGNGSSEQRIINTGGIGSCCFIWGYGYSGFVTPEGTFAISTSSNGYYYDKDSKFNNGVLTIASTSNFVNKSGTTYNYQVV